MIEGYRIVPFVPAGRKHVLEILFRYFQKHSDVIDEVMLWQNTDDEKDIAYINQIAKNNPLFKVYTLPEGYKFYHMGENTPEDKAREDYGPVQWNTGRFFQYCIDPQTIYIRFDDDIVYIDDNYFKNIVRFRLEHPEYWAVFGNIWNNAITSFLHQQEGNIGYDFGECDSYCMDTVGWGNGEFAEYIHNIFLSTVDRGEVENLYYKGGVSNEDVEWNGHGYLLKDGYRFSISNFAIFGSDYAPFGGKFDELDEEIYLTEIIPAITGRQNIICPDALVSHFTFSPHQKPYIMNETDLFKRYDRLSKEMLSKDYYKFLNTHK